MNYLVKSFEFLANRHPESCEYFFSKIIKDLNNTESLHCCLYAKEAGILSESDRLFSILISERPNDPAVYFESAVLKNKIGDYASAYDHLNKAIEINSNFEGAIKLQLLWHIRDGEEKAFSKKLEEYHKNGIISGDTVSFLQSCWSFASKPENKYEVLRSFTPDFLNATDVYAMIMDALQTDKSFGLTRLGDGEGAFLMSDKDDNHASLIGKAQDYYSQRWFGIQAPEGLKRLQAGLERAISSTTILGTPSLEWCAHEWQAGNLQTYACCVSALKAAIRTKANLTVSSIHIDLVVAGHLQEIISAAPSVCIVTCHSQLKDIFQTKTGQDKFTTILVPPAFSDLEMTNLKFLKSQLEEYNDILEQINKNKSRVFLIAAGFLGKFYVEHVAKSGNIALDVGSTLDAALGFGTRPNYEGMDFEAVFWDKFQN